MAEYTDHMTQRAYEEGARDMAEVLEPYEPDAADREWFDLMDGPYVERVNRELIDRAERMIRELAREREEAERETIADAMDHVWNGPR